MPEKKIVRAVSLEELNQVSGGRLVSMSEWDSYSEALRKAVNKQRRKSTDGNSVYFNTDPEEASRYMARFDAQYAKWIDDIEKAPEGSPDIMFDCYWNE